MGEQRFSSAHSHLTKRRRIRFRFDRSGCVMEPHIRKGGNISLLLHLPSGDESDGRREVEEPRSPPVRPPHSLLTCYLQTSGHSWRLCQRFWNLHALAVES